MHTPATTPADWALAERVSHHMQTHFPDTVPAASWTVAPAECDNTAVLVEPAEPFEPLDSLIVVVGLLALRSQRLDLPVEVEIWIDHPWVVHQQR